MSDGDHESHAVPVEMKAAMRLKSLNVPIIRPVPAAQEEAA